MRSIRKVLATFVVMAAVAAVAWAGESRAVVWNSSDMPHTSYMGVDVEDVSKDRVQALKLKSESGVEITMVDNDAPAGKAGLKEHDVILQFNGAAVESTEQLRRLIRETPPGRTVALGISRDGNAQTVNVTLAARKDVYKIVAPRGATPAWPATPAVPAMPPMPRIQIDIPEVYVMQGPSRVGLVVESLTPQLGEYFGAKNGEGLLVRSVEKGSPAEAAGFHAGDVIIKVDQQRVSDRSDWRSVLRNRTGKVPVGILREKRGQTLTLTLPDRKQSSKHQLLIDPDDFDVDVDVDEMALLAPEAIDLAMMKAQMALEQSKTHIKQSTSKIKQQMKQDVQRQKEEFKREQKQMQEQRKEILKQKIYIDSDNDRDNDKDNDNDNDRDDDNE